MSEISYPLNTILFKLITDYFEVPMDKIPSMILVDRYREETELHQPEDDFGWFANFFEEVRRRIINEDRNWKLIATYPGDVKHYCGKVTEDGHDYICSYRDNNRQPGDPEDFIDLFHFSFPIWDSKNNELTVTATINAASPAVYLTADDRLYEQLQQIVSGVRKEKQEEDQCGWATK
jgi:hypothetical protein